MDKVVCLCVYEINDVSLWRFFCYGTGICINIA